MRALGKFIHFTALSVLFTPQNLPILTLISNPRMVKFGRVVIIELFPDEGYVKSTIGQTLTWNETGI